MAIKPTPSSVTTGDQVNYLPFSFSAIKVSPTATGPDGGPRYGMTADGYTKRSGAPTEYMVKLVGTKNPRVWRRVMVYCISNNGSLFLRIKGELFWLTIDHEHRLQEAQEAQEAQERFSHANLDRQLLQR